MTFTNHSVNLSHRWCYQELDPVAVIAVITGIHLLQCHFCGQLQILWRVARHRQGSSSSVIVVIFDIMLPWERTLDVFGGQLEVLFPQPWLPKGLLIENQQSPQVRLDGKLCQPIYESFNSIQYNTHQSQTSLNVQWFKAIFFFTT